MSTGTLFGVPLSQPTRSCLMLIKEGGLNVNFEPVDLMSGAHKQEPFLTRNPCGLVPAYSEGDFNLSEGAAILVYLAESNNLTDWYPTDFKVRAKVNQWLHWNHNATRKSTTCVIRPMLFGGEVNSAAYVDTLHVLEKALANSKFVATSDKPTIADLMLLPELDQLDEEWHGTALVDYAEFPNIRRYIAELSAAVPSHPQNKADAIAIVNMIKSKGK